MKIYSTIAMVTALFSQSLQAQEGQVNNSDSTKIKLYGELLAAHRTYQDIAFFKAAQLKGKFGNDSEVMKDMAKMDSVFKTTRSTINALAFNKDYLPESQKEQVDAMLATYIANAKRYASQTKDMKTLEVYKLEKKFLAQNGIIDDKVFFDIGGDKVKPSLKFSFDIKLTYQNGINSKSYVVYLIPYDWLITKEPLCSNYDGKWKSMAACIGFLDRYAEKWSPGMSKRMDGLYPGKYAIIIVNSETKAQIHTDDFILPGKKEYEYEIQKS